MVIIIFSMLILQNTNISFAQPTYSSGFIRILNFFEEKNNRYLKFSHYVYYKCIVMMYVDFMSERSVDLFELFIST